MNNSEKITGAEYAERLLAVNSPTRLIDHLIEKLAAKTGTGWESNLLEFKGSYHKRPDSDDPDSQDCFEWNVMHAFIALANAQGGCVVIGIAETDDHQLVPGDWDPDGILGCRDADGDGKPIPGREEKDLVNHVNSVFFKDKFKRNGRTYQFTTQNKRNPSAPPAAHEFTLDAETLTKLSKLVTFYPCHSERCSCNVLAAIVHPVKKDDDLVEVLRKKNNVSEHIVFYRDVTAKTCKLTKHSDIGKYEKRREPASNDYLIALQGKLPSRRWTNRIRLFVILSVVIGGCFWGLKKTSGYLGTNPLSQPTSANEDARARAERIGMKAAYEKALAEFEDAHQGMTTYDMAMDANAKIAFLEKWANDILQWKISVANSKQQVQFWQDHINNGRKLIEAKTKRDSEKDNGSSAAYIFGYAMAGQYEKEINDMLMDPSIFEAHERMFDKIKSASGNFMGQTIHFADGVADWLDTSTDWSTLGEEYKNGYPMKMWIDREHMWEPGGCVFALLEADNAHTWDSLCITSDSSHKNLFAKFKDGKVIKFRLLKFDPKSNEFVYHLDEQNDRIFVNSRTTGKCEVELSLDLH